MLTPKKLKRRKVQRGRVKGQSTKGNRLTRGTYGLVALEPGWIKANQIEAARVAINKFIKRTGKMWINIFPHKPVTKKPLATRMGNGKGNVEFYVAAIKRGRVLFELQGVTNEIATKALHIAGTKLPLKTRLISNINLDANIQTAS